MTRILDKLTAIFDLNRAVTWTKQSLPELILALIVFLAFYVIYRVFNFVLSRVLRRVGMERTAAGFLLTITKYSILAFGAVAALEEIGINLTSILAGVGIIGLALGFAAKDTFTNAIAGFFLFWDKPFVIGDLIEVSDEYGEVRDITLRTTRIITVDGKMVSLPNSELINKKIRSYTMEPHLRLDIEATIGVNENIGRARAVILSILGNDGRFLAQPKPDV